MSFLPGSLTPALLRSCHRKVISHSDGHSVVGCRKQKEPITQSIRNRREHNSRFKVMFYVIGSENSKSGSAFYSSCQQNQRRGGAVRHFRCTDTVSDETNLWWNIGIQLLCSGDPLYHHYTDTSFMRQDCEALPLYSEFQRAIFNGIRKRSLYWLGHLGAIYQWVLEKILKNLSYTSRRNFQIRTLLNIFFDPFFRGVLCHNLNVWLFISQVVAGENGILSIALLRW